MQLKTNLGSAWPPKGWSAKSEEQKAEFWNHIKSISKAKDLVQYVEYIDESVRESIKGSSDKVRYLPLRVWGKKGYNKKLIKSKCTNTKDHPVLGKTYGIRLSELFELDQDRDTKGERCLIKKASGNAVMATPAKPGKLSEEDKAATKEAKEKLRVEKASMSAIRSLWPQGDSFAGHAIVSLITQRTHRCPLKPKRYTHPTPRPHPARTIHQPTPPAARAVEGLVVSGGYSEFCLKGLTRLGEGDASGKVEQGNQNEGYKDSGSCGEGQVQHGSKDTKKGERAASRKYKKKAADIKTKLDANEKLIQQIISAGPKVELTEYDNEGVMKLCGEANEMHQQLLTFSAGIMKSF